MRGALVDLVLARDARAISRALSLVADQDPGVAALLGGIRPHTGRAFLVGVTGPPGAGKSTLVDRLIGEVRRTGRTVAVLAIDPTSLTSGGAVLGDRVRMQAHASDAGVFIRSMATRGRLGGLAAATVDSARVLDAAGFDVVIIETVGVGQDEVDVARVADASIVVLVPGTGDDIQALKAGIMEIGDVFVINKADREGADRMVALIEAGLELDARQPGAWRPPVLRVVATTGAGVPAVLEGLERFRAAGPRQRDGGPRPPADEAWRFDHVGVAVRDASALLAFLEATGAAVVDRPEVVAGQRVRVRFAATGGTKLELVEPTDQGSPVETFLNTRGPGLHHIAFQVGDLPAMLASLKARGVRLIDEVPRTGAHSAQIAFIHPSSADGVLVELVAREADTRADR